MTKEIAHPVDHFALPAMQQVLANVTRVKASVTNQSISIPLVPSTATLLDVIPLAYDRMKRSHQDLPKSCPRRRNIFCHEKFHVREMRRELPDMLLCHRRRVSWFQCVEREYFWVSQSVRSKRLQVSANAMWQCARMHVTCVYNHFVNCPVKVYLLHSWICVRREEQEGVSKGNRSDGSQWPGKKTSAGLWGVWLKWCWTLRCVEHVFCSHLWTMLQHVQN